jgi:hypothetical protein
MKTYTCEQGSHDFRPNAFRLFIAPARFRVTFSLDASCWYSAEQMGDRHRAWKKVKGLTGAFGRNNANAAMIAYRSAPEENMFEIAAYVNFPGTQIKATILDKHFFADEIAEIDIAFARHTVDFIWDGTVVASLPFSRPWAMREIGPWFDTKRAAPHRMQMQAKLEIIR